MDLDLLPDAVIRLDADARVREANAAAEGLTGYQRGAMVGRRVVELISPCDERGKPLLRDGWHPAARLRSVGRLPAHRVRLRTAAGDEVEVSVTGRYERTSDGRLLGVTLSLRDLPRAAGEGAPSGMEVISTVSHELRSPLTSVKGYTSLLINRWERLGDEQKLTMLEQVNHDADRVTRLVSELLDISRLETGRLVLRRQMVDLSQVVLGVVAKVRMEATDMEADVRFPADFPPVYADPDKIEQVLTNLVENATKYADPTTLRVTGERDTDQVSVAVTDSGEGIPPADLNRIFTKFFRRASTRPTGSGLGLYISRGLVEAHGGTLTADSAEGTGSTFRFTLPLGTFEEIHGG